MGAVMILNKGFLLLRADFSPVMGAAVGPTAHFHLGLQVPCLLVWI